MALLQGGERLIFLRDADRLFSFELKRLRFSPFFSLNDPWRFSGIRMGSRRKYLRYIVALGLLVLLASAIGIGLLYRMFTSDLPNIATLQDYRPRLVTEVFSDEGDLIGEFFIEKRELVSLDKVPKVLQNAMIAAEDANFYQHEGLDFFGIIRAMMKKLFEIIT